MMSGVPSRKKEMLSIRYANTSLGGLRNLFVHNGLVVIRMVGDKRS